MTEKSCGNCLNVEGSGTCDSLCTNFDLWKPANGQAVSKRKLCERCFRELGYVKVEEHLMDGPCDECGTVGDRCVPVERERVSSRCRRCGHLPCSGCLDWCDSMGCGCPCEEHLKCDLPADGGVWVVKCGNQYTEADTESEARKTAEEMGRGKGGASFRWVWFSSRWVKPHAWREIEKARVWWCPDCGALKLHFSDTKDGPEDKVVLVGNVFETKGAGCEPCRD